METPKTEPTWLTIAKIVVKLATYALAIIGGSSFTEGVEKLTAML